MQHSAFRYCNNHMQVLGMLPKKERKPKNPKSAFAQFPNIHVGAMSDPGLLQNKLKPRLVSGTVRGKVSGCSFSSGSDDTEDVYAFPADNSDKQNKKFTALIQSVGSVSVVGTGTSGTSNNALSKSTSESSSGQSSLAKIYPELAEKLEKIKPKVEAKVKGKVKSSRTMNSLQTKIAQNKIKDKLRRNQSSSNTSSQSQSPSHNFMSNSPGYHINSSSPSHLPPSSMSVVQHNSVGTNEDRPLSMSFSKPVSASNQTTSSLPSLSNLNLLNGLNLQTLNLSLEQLGLPVPTVSDIEQTLKQLANAANIPLDGSTLSEERTTGPLKVSEGTSATTVAIPPLQTFSPQSGPPPPYPGVHHRTVAPVKASPQTSPVKQSVSAGHQIVPVSGGNTNSASSVVNIPLVTRPVTGSSRSEASTSVPTSFTALSSASTLSLATMSIPASFPNNMHPKLTLLTTSQSSGAASNTQVSQDSKLTAPSTAAQRQKPKPLKAKPRSRNPSASAPKRPVPQFSLPMTVVKPRKLRKVLDENEVKTLKTESAINLYNKNLKRKMDNHFLIYSGK